MGQVAQHTPLRVLHVIGSLPEITVAALVEAIPRQRDNGYTVAVATLSRRAHHAFEEAAERFSASTDSGHRPFNPEKVISLTSAPGLKHVLDSVTTWQLRKVVSDADVVHAHGDAANSAASAALLSLHHRPLLISSFYHNDELPAVVGDQLGNGHDQGIKDLVRQRIVAATADRILVSTPGQAAAWSELAAESSHSGIADSTDEPDATHPKVQLVSPVRSTKVINVEDLRSSHEIRSEISLPQGAWNVVVPVDQASDLALVIDAAALTVAKRPDRQLYWAVVPKQGAESQVRNAQAWNAVRLKKLPVVLAETERNALEDHADLFHSADVVVDFSHQHASETVETAFDVAAPVIVPAEKADEPVAANAAKVLEHDTPTELAAAVLQVIDNPVERGVLKSSGAARSHELLDSKGLSSLFENTYRSASLEQAEQNLVPQSSSFESR